MNLTKPAETRTGHITPKIKGEKKKCGHVFIRFTLEDMTNYCFEMKETVYQIIFLLSLLIPRLKVIISLNIKYILRTKRTGNQPKGGSVPKTAGLLGSYIFKGTS